MKWLFLIALFLATLTKLVAQESSLVIPGDQVRIQAPTISTAWIVGTDLSLDADSLVLNQKKNPWYSSRLAIPVSSITRVELKTKSSSRWRKIAVLRTDRVIVHLPAEPVYRLEGESIWLNVGVGVSNLGPSVGATIAYQRGKHLISVRYVRSKGYQFTHTAPPPERVLDIGILYGRVFKGSNTRGRLVSVSAGLGIVKYKEKSLTTVGIPLEVQVFGQAPWHGFTRFLAGFGLGVHANLNSKDSFGAILLSFQLGGIR